LNEKTRAARLSHVAALGPAYRIFDSIEAPELRREAGLLADLVTGGEYTIPPDFGEPAEAIPCLRRTLEHAQTDRRCAAFVLKNFGSWVRSLEGAARAAFLESFPPLGPAAADLGEGGMGLLLETIRREPRALPAIATYAMTDKANIRAITRIAATNSIETVQRLVAALPLSLIEEHREAEKLLPAVAEAPHAAAVAAAMLPSHVSAVAGVFRKLRKLPADAEYIENFRALVEAIGIQANGFCLTELVKMQRAHGPEKTREFVNAAVEIAREHGARAGQAWIEQRTPAAREFFS